MKAKLKLTALALLSGMSLGASAVTYHFTPVTTPSDLIFENLGKQLTMNVTDGGAGSVLFTFTNDGSLESSLSRIYVDDSPSNLFASFSISSQTGGVNYAMNADPPNLIGAEAAPFTFFATDSAGALAPRFNSGIKDSAEAPGDSLTLSGFLNTGKTFADVVASLSGGPPTQASILRVGLRVIGSINESNDATNASFLDAGAAAPPIPESSTYGMLLAGLGLITAIARRRQSGR